MTSEERAVLVLGDSALSSLGSCFDNALDRLCERLRCRAPLRFINPSAVGMTSADASVTFIEMTEKRRFDAVIVYVGNCDASAYGLLKPRSLLRNGGLDVRMRNALYKSRNPLARLKHPLQFAVYDIAGNRLRECVSPRDYGTFISRIVAHAAAKSIPAILLNPASKADFPPCNTMGNALFYKVVNVHDGHPFRGGEAARTLIGALSLHGAGALDEALRAYRELERAHARDELGSIAANNSGAVYAEQGNFAAAMETLGRVPPIRNPLYPIVLFNRAVVAMLMGDEAAARRHFLAAAGADRGTYRISRAHRDVLKRVAKDAGGRVSCIDAAEIMSDSDFIDYCHPNEAAHERLGERLATTLGGILECGAGDFKPAIEYVPRNPDRYAGARSSFFEHFGIVAAADGAFCREILAEAAATPYERILEAAFELPADPRSRARATILAHPIFGCVDFLRRSPPDAPCDRGRLPELYFLRHLIPIYENPERNGAPGRMPDVTRELVPKHRKTMVWWNSLAPSAGRVDPERLAKIHADLDAREILGRTAHLLRRILSREPVADDKYRTTTLWFFRESMIFGSVSHYSMLFDRLSMLHVIDTCLFMLRHAAPGSETARSFERVMAVVERILLVHRAYLAPVADRFYLFPSDRRGRYREELAGIQRSQELAALSAGSGGCSRRGGGQ